IAGLGNALVLPARRWPTRPNECPSSSCVIRIKFYTKMAAYATTDQSHPDIVKIPRPLGKGARDRFVAATDRSERAGHFHEEGAARLVVGVGSGALDFIHLAQIDPDRIAPAED